MSRNILILGICLAVTASTVGAEPAPRPTEVTLKMRKDSGDYNKAAYSFRKQTSDAKIHRNYVDLVFDKCGSLHVTPVRGQENRICDLGETTLENAPDESPADATWRSESVAPQAGHVYLEEINQHGQTMTVKFIVDSVTDDTVKLRWVTVKPLEGQDDPNRGAAGRKGQCGGKHADE